MNPSLFPLSILQLRGASSPWRRWTRQSVPAMAALLLATAATAQVGRTTLRVDELDVTLLYPTAEPARAVTFGPFTLQVAPQAVPTTGVRRLVVMSHGTGGSPMTDHAQGAALVAAGFVVAQPVHPGDNFADTSRAGPESWAERPRDVSRVIDALARDPAWQGRLALDRVGVHGMSAGGVTALTLAGGQWRVLDLVQHCLAHADDDLGFCFNGIVDRDARAARQARFERARHVPEWLLPADLKVVHGGRTPADPRTGDPRPDPRIAAVTVAVPVVAPFTASSLARITVPVGVVGAGRDTMLVPAFHSERLLRDCRLCARVADLPDAAHMDLLSPLPPGVASAVVALHPRGAAPTPGYSVERRTAAITAIAEFHRRHLAPPGSGLAGGAAR
jgi:predicted dienelactone hydrolase